MQKFQGENARKLVVIVILNQNLSKFGPAPWFFLLLLSILFQFQKTLQTVIFTIFLKVGPGSALKKAAGSGSALKQAAGSKSAKKGVADPQP